jgi:hypothetical protein
MQLNWKLILIGGVVFYLASWLLAPISVPLIHNGVLADDYAATSQFWRPELMNNDMAALMPRWIVTGLIGAFITAAVYGWVRPAFSGPGWKRGVKFGVVLILFSITAMLAWSGVFNLPNQIWGWWTVDMTFTYLISGAALGWVAEKVAPLATDKATPAAARPAAA